MKLSVLLVCGLGLVGLVGCGDGTTPTSDGGPRTDMGLADEGVGLDGNLADGAVTDMPIVDTDAGPRVDLGTVDGAVGLDGDIADGSIPDMPIVDTDGGASDAGAPDAGTMPDAGMCMDFPAAPSRPVAIACSPCRPPTMTTGGIPPDCVTDADCTAGANGRCSFGRFSTFCDYDTCFEDDDCAPTEVCLCDGSSSFTGGGNTCIPAGCRTDSDCGAFTCSPTLGSCGHYTNFQAYRCHTAADTCASDADCTAVGPRGYCAFDDVAGHWACSARECAG